MNNFKELFEAKFDINDEKFRALWDALADYNLMVNIPSEKAFQNKAKYSGLTKKEIKAWYNQVVDGA